MQQTTTKKFTLSNKECREAIYDYFVKKGIKGIFNPEHIDVQVLTSEFEEYQEINAVLQIKEDKIEL